MNFLLLRVIGFYWFICEYTNLTNGPINGEYYTNEFTYNIVIAFTYLDNEFACNERVSLRVKKGGHHVSFDDVQRRFGRSIANFWNIYRHHCNTWHLYYSSYDDLQEVARSGNDDIIVLNDAEFTIFKQIIKKYE